MIRTLIACFFLFCIAQTEAQTFRVATYNLRLDFAGDSGNLWKVRKDYVAELIRFHEFDIFGTQEGFKNQLDDLQTALPYYERYGIGRDDGATKGEHSAIFFRKDKFELLKSGDFWLSQTPEKPGFGWDAKINRICSWIQLKDKKSKKSFFVFNVHYDHQAMVARRESSKLILQRIDSLAGKSPVVLTGDFNGDHNSEWYQLIANSGVLRDTYKDVEHPYLNNGTFQNFGRNLNRNQVIDHIFVTKQFTTGKWGALTDTYNNKFPSDHLPVMAVITLK
jgi:endonuclease/exonuclease/phosphatase family metal-dependent hydrolase